MCIHLCIDVISDKLIWEGNFDDTALGPFPRLWKMFTIYETISDTYGSSSTITR